MMMNKIVIALMCTLSFNVFAEQLTRVTTINNSAVASNQIALSTAKIPVGTSVTVHCSFDNKADFTGYIRVTPYSGSFSGINYKTCSPTECGVATGSKIYFGLANTVINIDGVSRKNQAIVMTNYSTQNLSISCWF